MKRVVVVLGLLGCAVPTGKARPDTAAGVESDADLSDEEGEPSPTIGHECDVTETEVAVDEVLPIGASAAQLMGEIAGSAAHEAWYTDGTGTEITVTLQLGEGTAVFVEQVIPGTEDKDEVCQDHVRVPVSVVIATGDNAVVFDLPGELQVRDAQTHTLYTVATPADNRGTHSIALSAGETGTYQVEQVVVGEAVSGSIYVWVESVDGDVATVHQDLLLQWPEAD